jgi:hypothetical protein
VTDYENTLREIQDACEKSEAWGGWHDNADALAVIAAEVGAALERNGWGRNKPEPPTVWTNKETKMGNGYYTDSAIREMAYQAAGCGASAVMREAPDVVMPTETISAGVEAILAEYGVPASSPTDSSPLGGTADDPTRPASDLDADESEQQ